MCYFFETWCIGYMGDGFYRSKDATNSIKVLKEKAKENNQENTKTSVWICVNAWSSAEFCRAVDLLRLPDDEAISPQTSSAANERSLLAANSLHCQ